MRDTNMVDECLGGGDANVWKVLGGDRGVLVWIASAAAVAEAAAAAEHKSGTVVEVGCKLKLRDTKHMKFSSDADCLPLFYVLNAARDNCANMDK